MLHQPKEWGIVIQDLDVQNKRLLNKLLFKLCNEEVYCKIYLETSI
jgi:hypothetical protein